MITNKNSTNNYTLPAEGNNRISSIIETLIILLILLLPLIFYPYLLNIFNPAKELLLLILTIVMAALWTVRVITGSDSSVNTVNHIHTLPVLIFALIGITSLFWSNSRFVTIQEIPFFLSGIILYFVIINNIENNKQINRIISAIIIIGSLMGVYGVLQYLGIDFSFWKANFGRNKVFGLFGNVNYFAEYIIIPLTASIPILFSTRSKSIKALLLSGIIAMGASLFLTFTRGSYLGFTLSLFFIFFIFLYWKGKSVFKKYRKILTLLILVLLLFSIIIVVPNPLNEKGTAIYKFKSRTTLTRLMEDRSLGTRITTWKYTWLMIKDKPWFGTGLGTYPYNSLKYKAQYFNIEGNRPAHSHGIDAQAHNEYLHYWAELGTIGFLAFIWIIVSYYISLFKYLKKEKHKKKKIPSLLLGLAGAITAVLIDSLFGFPLHLPASASLFWIMIGLTVVLQKMDSSAESQKIYELPVSVKDRKNINKSKFEADNTNRNRTFLLKYKYLKYLAILITIVLSVLAAALVCRPFVAQIYEYHAIKNIERDNSSKAIEYYEIALKWNPYLGMAYFNIGQILLEKELYTTALEYFEKSANFIDHPNLPENLAYLYNRKGLTEKAVSKLEEAITYKGREKGMAPLLADLGKLYMQLKRYKDAEGVFRKAILINSKDIEAHLGFSVSLLNQNKREEAIEELRKIVEIAPWSKEAEQATDILQQLAREKLGIP